MVSFDNPDIESEDVTGRATDANAPDAKGSLTEVATLCSSENIDESMRRKSRGTDFGVQFFAEAKYMTDMPDFGHDSDGDEEHREDPTCVARLVAPPEVCVYCTVSQASLANAN